MRLFVAVDLEPEIRDKIGQLIEDMKSREFDVKFTKPGNLHFTLKFLGEVEEGRIPEIESRISDALKGAEPFKISIEGLGYFGSHNFIRVIWLDVKLGREMLVELSRKMKVLDYIRPDDFEHKPHITIGRPRSGKNRELLLREIEKMKFVKFGGMDVKFVKLKQSILQKDGPVYSDVKVFELV